MSDPASIASGAAIAAIAMALVKVIEKMATKPTAGKSTERVAVLEVQVAELSKDVAHLSEQLSATHDCLQALRQEFSVFVNSVEIRYDLTAGEAEN